MPHAPSRHGEQPTVKLKVIENYGRETMSNRDGFAGGFFAGALVGGFVGGVLGVLLSRRPEESAPSEERLRSSSRPEAKAIRARTRQIKEETIEVARRSLEDKIAQLNDAIDDVRLQLNNVNGTPAASEIERSLPKDT